MFAAWSSHACLCGLQWYVYIIFHVPPHFTCIVTSHVTCANAPQNQCANVSVIHCACTYCQMVVLHDQHNTFLAESQLVSRMKAFLFLLAIVSFTLVAAQEPQRCSKFC